MSIASRTLNEQACNEQKFPTPLTSNLSSDLQNDEKAKRIEALGLRVIPIAAKSTPKRNPQELEEDLAQYNPQVCCTSLQITQGKIISLIRKLHEGLLYIPYDHFKRDIRSLTMRLIKHIKGENYAVGLARNKSNTWVAEHALQHVAVKDLPSKTFELEERESSESVSTSLKEAIQAGIKKFVIFDDFIFSGSQMESHILRCMRAFNDSDLQLIIVSVYTSESFTVKLKNLKGKVKLITTKTVLPSIEEVLEKSDIALLKKIYPKSSLCGCHYLVYSEWKVADIKSVPEFLLTGLRLKEDVFRFIRSREPLYPPYKDREVLEDIYTMSDPFENTQDIHFG